MGKVKVTRNCQITLPKNIRKKNWHKVRRIRIDQNSGEVDAVLKKLIPIEDLANLYNLNRYECPNLLTSD